MYNIISLLFKTNKKNSVKIHLQIIKKFKLTLNYFMFTCKRVCEKCFLLGWYQTDMLAYCYVQSKI